MDGSDPRLRIIIASDRVTASVRISPGSGEPLTPEAVLAQLEQRSVAHSRIDQSAVESLTARAAELAEGDEPIQEVVARGIAPIAGEDGWIQLKDELADWFDRRERERRARRTTQLEGYDHAAAADDQVATTAEDGEQTGTPDAEAPASSHYDRSAYCMVSRGQHLADLRPPTAGEDGLDVTGMTIAARDGKPVDFQAGDTLKVREGRIFAAVDGHLEFDGLTLRVARELVIAGSIDFSTGNVVGFDGDVVVDKGIKDCFIADIGGSLRVRGMVEAATLKAGRDITLEHGMAAREKGTIWAGRDLEARYLDSTQGGAGRDLIIHREVTGCTLTIGRNADCGKATLIGGSTSIIRIGDWGQIGTEASTPTEVILGKVPSTESLASEACQTLPALEQAAAKARERLEQLRSAGGKLTPRQAEELTELQFDLATADQKIPPLRAALERLLKVIDARTNPSLTVRKSIHEGVVLWMGRYRCQLTQTLKGPLRIEPNADRKPIVIDLTSSSTVLLSTLAKVVPSDRFVDLCEIRTALGRAA